MFEPKRSIILQLPLPLVSMCHLKHPRWERGVVVLVLGLEECWGGRDISRYVLTIECVDWVRTEEGMVLAKVVQKFRDAPLGVEKNSGRDDGRRTYPQPLATWLRPRSIDSLSVLADGKENGILVSMRTTIFRDESPMTKTDNLA